MMHSIFLPLRNLTFFVALAAMAAGCTRAPDLVYSTGEVVEKLPPAHKTQIETKLSEYFGSPVDPRLLIVAEEQPESDDEEEEVIALEDAIDPDELAHGAAVFNRRCAGCHGITGDGNGEAAPYLQPKPRDYRQGKFKFTSTPFGRKPRKADLIYIIRKGAKGTSMPSFKFLPDEDLKAVASYVVMLSYRGELELLMARIAEQDYDEDEEIDAEDFTDTLEDVHKSWVKAQNMGILPVTAQPEMTDETILAGRKAFLSKGCVKCHGTDFRGQTEWLSHEFIAEQETKPEGERILINYDDWGHPAPAADLTAGMLHGGRRPIDVYRRIYTGITGSVMPESAQSLAEEPETIWHLVHYVLSVIDQREVEGIEDVQPEETESPAEE